MSGTATKKREKLGIGPKGKFTYLKKYTFLIFVFFIFLILIYRDGFCEIVIKCATISPKDSPWSALVEKASKEISDATGGEVRFEWYTGGAAGDEPELAKKVKEGKLDCAGLTGNGISYLIPPLRILELPFLLKNYAEVDYIKKRMEKFFINIARDYNMKFLWVADLGFVYIFSNFPINKLDDVRGKRVWVWKGDYMAEFIGKVLSEDFKIKPFPIPIADVKGNLDSLEILYNTPYALTVLGWDNFTKFILIPHLNWAFVAIIFSNPSFSKIPPQHQGKVEEILKKYLDNLTKMNRESDLRTLAMLERKGISKISLPPEEVDRAENLFREKVWVPLKDKLYPSWLLTQLLTEIQAMRAKEGK
jgi:TRAP-type C4-dicarboxylate transport system substrate-binding protein